MQKSQTSQKPQGLSNTQESAEANGKENYPLITREKIPNTPFWIIGYEEKGYHITWGRYRFNENPINTEEECYIWYHENLWEITTHMIAIGLANHEELHHGSNQPK